MSQVSVERSAYGDTDIAAVGSLVADRARCRILLALGDGRALPASRLSGALGRGLLDRLVELGWVQRSDGSRAVKITGPGQAGLDETFGIRN